jgi:cytosine/uracil/thiamine/allantoin permease
VLGIGVWLLGREPGTLARLLFLAPAVMLPIGLFLLPGNLPPQAAWGIVDLVGRAETTSVMPVVTGATFWSASIWLMSANDARRMPSQLGQVAASIAGVLPWLFASLAFALAVLSSGKGDGGLFDLPALACRRLSSSGLVALLGVSALGFLWPLVIVAKNGVKGGMQELATSVPVRRSGEWLALVLMLMLAIMSRASFVTVVLDVLLYLAALYVVMSLCIVAHYYAVDRGHFVLDDLYSERGAYRGIVGVAPAGVLAVLAGVAAFSFTRGVFEATALRAAMAVPVAMLAQVIFGNVQRLLVR